MAYSKIIDNERKKLLDILKDIAPSHNVLSIATGYWDLPGMMDIFDSIKNYTKVRILIGREPLVRRDSRNNIDIEIDYPEQDIFKDLEQIQSTLELRELVQNIRTMVHEGRLEVRIYRASFLHAKCYIFGDMNSANAIGIIGSSNFTHNGMSINTELNALEDQSNIITFDPKNSNQEHGYISWYNEKWNNPQCEEWNGKFIEILGQSPVGDILFSPYEMYIHILYLLYYDDYVDTDPGMLDESKGVLHEFQLKNAQLLIKKLKRSGVAMLADSVGLGKTITAGAVIKHYLEIMNIKKPRIEVIVPSNLEPQWISELSIHHGIINTQNGVNITSLQNPGDLDERRKLDKYWPVNLFVIDEAHNLRKEDGTRYQYITDWIRENQPCPVLLVTATPINNQLMDFAAQINMATAGDSRAFIIQIPKTSGKQYENLDYYDAINNLDSQIKRDRTAGKPLDIKKIQAIMRPILSHFMVRATRTHIQKKYGGVKDADGNIIRFPDAEVGDLRYTFPDSSNIANLFLRSSSLPIEKMLSKDAMDIIDATQLSSHPIDLVDTFSDSEEVFSTLHQVFLGSLYLGMPMYRPSIYKHAYHGKTIEQINSIIATLPKEEKYAVKQQMVIHNIMRILYLKRSESSVYAFRRSLEAYKARLSAFKLHVHDGYIVRISNLAKYTEMQGNDIFSLENEKELETIREAITTEYAKDILICDIDRDEELVDILIGTLKSLETKDTKMNQLVEFIREHKKNHKKILIFSYFADTVSYLENSLPRDCSEYINHENSGFVSGKNKSNAEEMANRFSPVSKKYTLKEGETEIDTLVSTDVLSEGQNLQDADTLINYDLHWNPVRMIQRNGRINRLGGKHTKIYIYNMSPAKEIEAYLKLEERLKSKIDLIKHSIGTDQSVMGETINAIDFLDDTDIINSRRDLYDIEGDKLHIIERLENEADIMMTEDEFTSDLQYFDSTATPEMKDRVYRKIPIGKWGVLPKNIVPHPSPVISLVETSIIDEGDISNPYHLFVKSDPQGNTLSVLDKIDALGELRTTADIKWDIPSMGKYDIRAIENTVKLNIQQIAGKAIADNDNDIKKTQGMTIEYLRVNNYVQWKDIEDALRKCQNRHDKKELKRLIEIIYKRIKNSEPVENHMGTLAKLFRIASRVCASSQNTNSILSETFITHSYHVQP